MDFSNNDCEKIIDSKLNGNVFCFILMLLLMVKKKTKDKR